MTELPASTEGRYCPIQCIQAYRNPRSNNWRLTAIGLERYCARCGDLWPADTEFFYPSRKSGGVHTWCRACFNEERMSRRRRAKAANQGRAA
ncbi:MAG: hypothetical protein ACLFRB_06660 [Thiohalorhabdus sp.]|uniref:hypothetical protein n=1 Tax=Thiohalorhabdus sp. TaxID=3094134 RepID=UPI0039808746